MQEINPALVKTRADHEAATAQLQHLSQPGEYHTEQEKWKAILAHYRPSIRYYAALYRPFLKPFNSTRARNELMHAVTCGFTIAHINYVSSDDFARQVDKEVHQMVWGILGPECRFEDFLTIRQITLEERRLGKRMSHRYFEISSSRFKWLRGLQLHLLHGEELLEIPEDTGPDEFEELYPLDEIVNAELDEIVVDPSLILQ